MSNGVPVGCFVRRFRCCAQMHINPSRFDRKYTIAPSGDHQGVESTPVPSVTWIHSLSSVAFPFRIGAMEMGEGPSFAKVGRWNASHLPSADCRSICRLDLSR